MLKLVPDSIMGRPSTHQFPPTTTTVAPELGRAFDAACRNDTPENSETLRSASIAFVERLKRDALPPERVIVALKAAVLKYGGSEAPPYLTDQALDKEEGRRAAVYHRVFGWCLDAYFDGR